jgi:hypothetical protein
VRVLRIAALAVLSAAVAGCAGRQTAPPGAGYERGGVPELRGARVLLLPLQLRTGGHPDFDRELEFALRQGPGGADWVAPAAIREMLERSPGTRVAIDQLPVRAFLAGELLRVGDPLFGELYRLGALAGASWALLPVEAKARTEGSEEAIELSAALVDVRTGQVVWFGIVAGSPGAPGALATSASAAEALARRVSG